MPGGAVFCTECENFQDGRLRVRFAKEVLPMIVALVAVVGAVVPPILHVFDRPDSNLVVSEVHWTRIGVTNLGDAPGIVNSIQMEWGLNDMPLIAGSAGVSAVAALDDPVVRPGETRWFDLALPAAAAQRFNLPKESDPLDLPCSIVVVTTTARQSQQYRRFQQSTCGVMFNALPALMRPQSTHPDSTSPES
jgi:hypothetical protein